MKILKLTAENIKRLKAIEITPEGNLVIISGKNAEGKTSVLDAIWWALGGKKNIQERPIRDGQEKAFVTLDLGDLTVTRTWTTNDKSYLKVETSDNATYKSPQSMLDSLVGKLSFDPLEFALLDTKKQREILLKLVDLGIDLDATKENYKRIYDERTQLNRDIRNKVGELEEMVMPDHELPSKKISITELLADLSKAQNIIISNDEERQKLKLLQIEKVNFHTNINKMKKQRDDLNQMITGEEKKFSNMIDRTNDLTIKVSNLKDPDLEIISQEIKNAEQTNNEILIVERYNILQSKIQAIQNKADELTDKLFNIENQKNQAIKQAKFPIDKLSIDDTQVLFKGIPFKQCSSAEQLQVSLSIAMALNPKLKIIRITDGSLLDKNNMLLLAEIAEKHDFQIWIERVDEDGKMGILIEDGMIKQ